MLRAKNDYFLQSFLLFGIFYFSYVYFFRFDEGISHAPSWIKAAKDVVYLLLLALLAPSFKIKTDWQAWVFLPFTIAIISTSILHTVNNDTIDYIWQNIKNIVIFLPIYYFLATYHFENCAFLAHRFIIILIFASTVQSIFSFLYEWSGNKLWDFGIFAGLVGNPNSFGLIINLSVGSLLAHIGILTLRQFMVAICFIALSTVTILKTTSGSQFVILLFLVPYALLFFIQNWKRYVVVAATIFIVTSLNSGKFFDVIYTMSNIGIALNNKPADEKQIDRSPNVADVSLSVSNRVKDFRTAMSVLSDPMDAIFGSFKSENFKPMDGQFLVFLYNSGLITLLPFLAALLFIYLSSLVLIWKSKDRLVACLHFMFVIFGITFFASRVLMYFPLNFIFCFTCGLLVRLTMAANTEFRNIKNLKFA